MGGLGLSGCSSAFDNRENPWIMRNRWKAVHSRLEHCVICSMWREVNFAADSMANHGARLQVNPKISDACVNKKRREDCFEGGSTGGDSICSGWRRHLHDGGISNSGGDVLKVEPGIENGVKCKQDRCVITIHQQWIGIPNTRADFCTQAFLITKVKNPKVTYRCTPPSRFCNAWALFPEFSDTMNEYCWATPLNGNDMYTLT
ncbi:hypothetical protein IFM89_012916 [Coptis chinensis]|uniref:Uncharacterized protein n=1 Tax=Coptis chinensis TaxID=261450 RepID=A0A835HEC2_9MAGN|nr:hypothetical protein IFM89_012916 [Coptis chinensis]